MIVEDEVITAMAMRMGFIELGYEVCKLVYAGEEAIEQARQEYPDIVLLDINLKGEMDGFETARQIKAKYNIPIAFLTGYMDSSIIEQIKAAEPVGYFVKPVELSELKSVFDRTLRLPEKEVPGGENEKTP